MNTLTKGFAKRVISMLLVTIMVFSLGIVGLTSISAANVELAETGGTYWKGNVYFLAPASWNLDTYSHIQIALVQDSSGNGNYTFHPSGEMGRIGSTRLFHYYIEEDHGSWSTEYISFTARSSRYDTGDFSISSKAGYYTKPSDYRPDGTSAYYLFVPSDNSASTNNAMTGSYSSSRDLTKATQTVKITTDGSASTTGGTVKISGSYLSADTTLTSSSASTSGTSASYGACQGSSVTLTATTKTGYKFDGWYDGSTRVSTSTTYSYTVFGAKTYTAKFVKSVSFSNVTISAPEEAVIGNDSVIQLGYTVSGSSSTPTYQLLQNGATYNGDYTVDVANKTITVASPSIPGIYNFSVKITVDGVSYTTDVAPINYKAVYSASLKVDDDEKYTDDTFTFTIDDNSDLYDGVTYKVYCNDAEVTPTITDNTFTVSHTEAGTYTYYVVATVDGENVYTDKVTITVKAKVFSVYLTAPKSTMEDRPFEIKATTEFADGEVTYTLIGEDGTNITNTTGIFSVTVNTVGEYTFKVTASDGVNTDATDSVIVTITEDKGTYPVKIYFKCSDTYGYLPNAKIDGTAVTLTKESSIITYNATDTATYSWYSYTVDGEVDYGTKITFAVNANRNYFYNASFTVSAGEGDYVSDGTYYCYYLALENLNGGTSILSNISSLEEAERNWTESAVNMIYDDADALAPVALNFAYADMADANTDGNINIKDATYIQKSLANVVEASALSTSVSDVNNDGKVTIKDATALQKQLANL